MPKSAARPREDVCEGSAAVVERQADYSADLAAGLDLHSGADSMTDIASESSGCGAACLGSVSMPPSWPRLSVHLPSKECADSLGDYSAVDGARSAEIH